MALRVAWIPVVMLILGCGAASTAPSSAGAPTPTLSPVPNAFRARPNTRSIGAATCGQSTANTPFRLSDGAMLQLTTASMADRTRIAYGVPIAPDEPVSDPEVLPRAIAWLRSK